MNGTTRFLWVFLLSLMAHLAAHAQKYQIRPLGLEQGLSCNYVVSMAQDKHGFLWIATEEGLNRFDGNRFFNYYKRRDRQGISSSELNCVIDDAKAPVVWIGTKNDGLNSFNYQTEEWHCYKHDAKDAASIATNDITKITQSEDGKLWISTYWAGVEQLDPATGKYQLRAEKVNHEKEQKLNEERLRFFTNITHELRTPLTLILGPLDDISHSSDISKAVKHKLAVIHQSISRN